MEPNQSPGSQFQLMPGEAILSEFRLTLNVVPAATCYVRITNQRLVICQISRWLTVGLSWLCAFIKAKKITLSLMRQDIASATIVKGKLGRKLLVLKCANNSEYQYYPNGFSSNCLNQVVAWWQSGHI